MHINSHIIEKKIKNGIVKQHYNFLKQDNSFSLYDLYGHALAEPSPGVHEIYNFGTCINFLGHHYYIVLSLSDLCLGVEKKIFKEIMHFHYMTYVAMPQQRTPAPG